MANADFQSFVDEVIDKNDITEVISEYAKVKRVGTRFAALCPLHNDKKSPSLSISPDKQLFHCFGCGAGGNVIHFIMAAEHLDFMDALKMLADRAKIEIPEFSKSLHKKDTADKKQLIYNINSEAARYFYSNLAGNKGTDALAYLKNRGIKNSTIKMFGLGYAPEGWTSLIDHLKSKGYSEHEVYEAGLAKMRDNGTYYDAFYDGRVMFPIINVQGNIIGFGGRIMTDKSNTGKYLNSPETLVFKKKENLFGINLAKNDKSGRLLLMEGYMDVISLHQEGITNAVASLGTAFTEQQAKIVKRYGGKAVLCYDSDEAGKKATIRAGEILTSHDIKTKVLTIVGGKDPDEFVRAKGGDMFRVLIESAKPFIEYRIDEIQKQYIPADTENTGFCDPEDRLEFTEAAAKILAEIKNPVEYEIYAKRVSEKTGISVDSINASVLNIRRGLESEKGRREEGNIRRRNNESVRSSGVNVKIFNAEQLLLSLLCDKSVYKIVSEKGVGPNYFLVPLHRKLAEIIFDMFNKFGSADVTRILDSFDENDRGNVAKILLNDKNVMIASKACLQPLQIIIEANNRIRQEEMLKSGDLETLDNLLKKSASVKKNNKPK